MPYFKVQKTPSGVRSDDDRAARVGAGSGRLAGIRSSIFKRIAKRFVVASTLAAIAFTILPASVHEAEAAGDTRSLKLYFVHTGEKATITYKRNGRFDPRGLAQLNQFLRDWRQNQPTKMDPRLFDLVWEVYQRSGATDSIHIVSAFRSPTTNGMLRGRSRKTGVAKNSQHMLGKAMDFYIPGVKLSTLRALAMQMQVGGVGFYPTSGSPFVHLDVGGVRAWPRMTRKELVQIFPKGNTLHLPADGNPLPGYEVALADYKKRVGSDSIAIASTAGGSIRGEAPKRRGFLAALFGGGGADEVEDNEDMKAPMVASRGAPRSAPAADDGEEAPVATARVAPTPTAPTPTAPTLVAAAEPVEPAIAAPVPLSRPAFRSDSSTAGPGGLATALYQPTRNAAQDALAMQTAAAADVQRAENFADLSGYAIPVPTLLGPRGLKGDAETSVLTASIEPAPFENLGSVPVPIHRPGAPAAPLVASRPQSDQQSLTPELVAALSRSVEAPVVPAPQAAPARAPAQAVAVSAPVPMAAPAQRQMAAISPKVIQPSTKQMQFGDGFDAPRPATASLGTMPSYGTAKSGRSGKPATAQGQAKAGKNGLTGDMVAKWAVNNNRAEGQNPVSMKAPRVVSRTLDRDYSAGYTSSGFKPVSAAVAIDPNRFSGQD
ncbi:DUF882 domain-containing protein [Rhizobium sp. CFBP 13726]|uniref:DUF882 domain-containing protein n=1 Tax=Rhizobium sp. CFBP 13726 TaxID=2775296 RepID=UPI0018FE1FD9|nr:DUF882 domain-containing protein [Rhizobium sp. CFBP 13726]